MASTKHRRTRQRRTTKKFMKKGGYTRTRGRSRSITPEWATHLEPGVVYRFRTSDNHATQVGTFVQRSGSQLIFMVNGHRTTYPTNIIAPMQPRQRLPGFDAAFVRL